MDCRRHFEINPDKRRREAADEVLPLHPDIEDAGFERDGHCEAREVEGYGDRQDLGELGARLESEFVDGAQRGPGIFTKHDDDQDEHHRGGQETDERGRPFQQGEAN